MVKTTTGTIYVSSDGKKFIDRDECLKHENELKAFNDVKYYKIKHDLINAASGEYNECTYFAISEPKIKGCYYNGLDALEEYCLINYAGKQDKSLFYKRKSRKTHEFIRGMKAQLGKVFSLKC